MLNINTLCHWTHQILLNAETYSSNNQLNICQAASTMINDEVSTAHIFLTGSDMKSTAFATLFRFNLLNHGLWTSHLLII